MCVAGFLDVAFLNAAAAHASRSSCAPKMAEPKEGAAAKTGISTTQQAKVALEIVGTHASGV